MKIYVCDVRYTDLPVALLVVDCVCVLCQLNLCLVALFLIRMNLSEGR